MHWAIKYIGGKWRRDQDCLYWYRKIKFEQFGREVKLCRYDHKNLVRSAAAIMAGDIESRFGYRETTTPVDGDAVFLTQRNQPHHIGMFVVVGGKDNILHAVEGSGVICSDMTDLINNGWTIKGYWTDEN